MLYIGLLLLILICVLSLSPKRYKKIHDIIKDLEIQLGIASTDQKYAIQELLIFFRSIYTLPGFIAWGLLHRGKTDGTRLLELADLPLPKWEAELYSDLSHVERKAFPGLSKPLRNILVDYLNDNDKMPLLDLGCGSMEVERQALTHILRYDSDRKPLIVGIDVSADAFASIKENFADFAYKIRIQKILSLTDVNLINTDQPTILFYCGDALDVAQVHGHKFGMIFSSRFRHHLNSDDKKKLDMISHKHSHYVVEYDDFRTAASWLPPILTAWYRPVLLSAAQFSQLRQPAKQELIKQKRQSLSHLEVKLFNPPGSYARTYRIYDTEKLKHATV